MEKLNTLFQAASQDMYNAANPQGAQDTGNSSDSGAEKNPQDEVTDVDFEEVNEKK
jgi:molecular chaperone DnaK